MRDLPRSLPSGLRDLLAQGCPPPLAQAQADQTDSQHRECGRLGHRGHAQDEVQLRRAIAPVVVFGVGLIDCVIPGHVIDRVVDEELVVNSCGVDAQILELVRTGADRRPIALKRDEDIEDRRSTGAVERSGHITKSAAAKLKPNEAGFGAANKPGSRETVGRGSIVQMPALTTAQDAMAAFPHTAETI